MKVAVASVATVVGILCCSGITVSTYMYSNNACHGMCVCIVIVAVLYMYIDGCNACITNV